MTETTTLLLALLTVAAQIFLAALVILYTASRFLPSIDAAWRTLLEAVAPMSLGSAWVVAAVATGGSLYFSEAAHYAPCELCWYQRVAIYPMVVVLGIAALRKDPVVAWYAVPVVLAGAAISAYHYQLQRLPSQASEFCDPLNPCSFTWVWEFHYISIPLMALTAGMTIATLVALNYLSARDVGERSTNADQN